ncbi:MAG: type II toxin-antitoxin system death-on-curing family toxin [Dongiaceae bacterium]
MAIAIHHRQLAEHGGSEGVRDKGLLSSALNRPIDRWYYSDIKPSIWELAKDYAFAIARNHPFIDGNKRTAYVVCRLFFLMNGHNLEASTEEKYLNFYKVAAGEITEEEFAAWLKEHLVKA